MTSLIRRVFVSDKDGKYDWDVLFERKGIEALSDGLRNYWTALGITSALIGSISFSAFVSKFEQSDIFVDMDDFSDETKYGFACTYHIMMLISTLCAILAIIFVTGFYNQFITFTADDDAVLWFMHTWPCWLPDALMIGSIAFLLFGVFFSVLLVLPRTLAIVTVATSIAFVVGFLLYFLFFTCINKAKKGDIVKKYNKSLHTSKESSLHTFNETPQTSDESLHTSNESPHTSNEKTEPMPMESEELSTSPLMAGHA